MTLRARMSTRVATNLQGVSLPMLIPGVRATTTPTNYTAISQMQLIRFDGQSWRGFGDLISSQ
jgi:branched-chain amino acid transport system substrate-binding protein